MTVSPWPCPMAVTVCKCNSVNVSLREPDITLKLTNTLIYNKKYTCFLYVCRGRTVTRVSVLRSVLSSGHKPCVCSVAQFVLPQCKLGSDQRQILRETFRGKDRRLHFEKCTKMFAKIHVIFFNFQIVNIRKDCLVRLTGKPYKLTSMVMMKTCAS